jgi:hypothetical protein
MKSPGMGYPINRTPWRAAEADPAAEKLSRTGLDRTNEIRGPISRRAFPSRGLGRGQDGSDRKPGAWGLGPGTWNLEPGAWSLELEPGA